MITIINKVDLKVFCYICYNGIMKTFFLYGALICAAGWILFIVFGKSHIVFYYPYADDLSIFEQSDGSVGSFQDCRWWAYKRHQLAEYNDARYGCGTKCQYDEDQEYYVCKEVTAPREIDSLK